MSRAVTERTLLAGPGIRVTYEQSGTRIHSLAEAGGLKFSIKRLFVKTVRGDYIECASDEDGAATFKVAKPWKLQRTPWHGETVVIDAQSITYTYTSAIARRASDGTTTETQVIIPHYIEERDWIFAVSADTDVVDSGGAVVTLQDLNVDGRAWAKV